MAKGDKMQEVDFKSIDEFLAFLPEEELLIVERLRKLIFYCLPEVREKLSFNVPYYFHHRHLCFIWPASVTWAKRKPMKGFALASPMAINSPMKSATWIKAGVNRSTGKTFPE